MRHTSSAAGGVVPAAHIDEQIDSHKRIIDVAHTITCRKSQVE